MNQMTKLGLLLATAFLAAACGGDDGGSGVDSGKTLGALSASEQTALCEHIVEVQGGAGHVSDCGGGVTVTTDTVAECVTGFADLAATCAATVGQAETCAAAIGAAPCTFEGSPECTAVITCFTGV